MLPDLVVVKLPLPATQGAFTVSVCQSIFISVHWFSASFWVQVPFQAKVLPVFDWIFRETFGSDIVTVASPLTMHSELLTMMLAESDLAIVN